MRDVLTRLVERCRIEARKLIPDIHLDCWDTPDPVACKEAITLWKCVTPDFATGDGDEVTELLEYMLIVANKLASASTDFRDVDVKISQSKYLRDDHELKEMLAKHSKPSILSMPNPVIPSTMEEPKFVIQGIQYISLTDRVKTGKLWWHSENRENH